MNFVIIEKLSLHLSLYETRIFSGNALDHPYHRDIAGRCDMMHMRLTTSTAFIRFVGCNVDKIDYQRLDDWVARIVQWKKAGLRQLCFFVHQNVEKSSPLFSAYLIEKLNKRLNLSLHARSGIFKRTEKIVLRKYQMSWSKVSQHSHFF